ncbi:MAG: UvrD-helicase domain-containing protein [Balneolaceae bacterium]|nr:UvrD-helicase domain-containing protein [Balneolaceae bacterium]
MAEAVKRIRKNDVQPKAGYDGVYGVISVFEHGEIDKIRGQLGFFGGIDCAKGTTEEQSEVPEKNASVKVEEYATSSGYGLNEQQEKVKQSVEGTTLVKAGPGTGKTHTLVEWMVNQVESGRVKPSQLMAVTFTNKAAEELQGRLKKRLGDRATLITIGTFHAIGWRLLKQKINLDTIYNDASRRMTLRFLFPKLNTEERQNLELQMLAHFEREVIAKSVSGICAPLPKLSGRARCCRFVQYY